ncbi:MAG: hypothetical protein LBM70_06260 [Victivallales bacterium]|jgi:hypothetical protein|nr:hypothetical protein [Victivallales bacterium]
MKHSFYDVKAKAKVTADVIACVTFGDAGRKRYAFKAKTADGRSLTAFVGKDVWEKGKAQVK